MEGLMWYLLFAVTTSVTALYELFVPVFRDLKALSPDNNIVQYKWICYFTLFCFTLLLAPLMLPVCIIPRWGERFKAALVKELA